MFAVQNGRKSIYTNPSKFLDNEDRLQKHDETLSFMREAERKRDFLSSRRVLPDLLGGCDT